LLPRNYVVVLIVALCACTTQHEPLNFENSPSTTTAQSSFGTESTVSLPPNISVDASTEQVPGDVVTQLRRDFAENQTYLKQCLLAPKLCDVTRITAPHSPWRSELTQIVHDYSVAHIRSLKDSGVVLVRIDTLNIVDTESAIINACTYDSMVLVDAGATDSTSDDIIFNDAVASYLSQWKLKLDKGKWKWFSWTSSKTKFNVDQCGFIKP